jgi:hypothetical protein
MVLKPAVSSPSESKLHHINCIQCSDACYTHLTVQAPAVVAHLAGDAPLCRHCPIQFFARFVQYLWSLHHCSLFLAFLGVFIRGLAHWLCLRCCQPILCKAAYKESGTGCYVNSRCPYWVSVCVLVVVVVVTQGHFSRHCSCARRCLIVP